MAKRLNITNQVFGRLIVITPAPNKGRYCRWLCFCECGKFTMTITAELIRGAVKSCGCLQKEILGNSTRTHGMRNTSEWHIWAQMIGRCTNLKNKSYKNYGERGIIIEDLRWFSFSCFIEDMGLRPNKKLTLERRDNSRGYSSENCYWADRFQQSRNRRNVHKIEHQEEIKSVAEWCQILNIKAGIIYHRINRGMGPQAAFNKSVVQLATLDLSTSDGNP